MPVILLPKHVNGLWKFPTGTPLPMDQRTLSELYVQQRAYLLANPGAAQPQEINDPKDAYIGAGSWRVTCRCFEAPHADPETNTALCFGCGAIFTNVVFPENRQDIEDLLVNRPVQIFRNWQKTETFDDLVEEQLGKGDFVDEAHLDKAQALVAARAAETVQKILAEEPEEEKVPSTMGVPDLPFEAGKQ